MASGLGRGHHLVDDEDSTKLILGRDFQGAGCLIMAEVKQLLEKKGHSDNPVYKKTLEYVTTFSRFSDAATASRARGILVRDPALHDFETCQIGNLCPHEAEEAKALIPSLAKKVEDEELQSMLNEIDALRKMQS